MAGQVVNTTDLLEFIKDFRVRNGTPINCITVRPEVHDMLKENIERLISEEISAVDNFYGVRVYVDPNQIEPMKIGEPDD